MTNNGRESRIIDCMLIGFNDYDFDEYVETLEVMGRKSVGFRDTNLSFITYEGRKYRALDIFSAGNTENETANTIFDNSDFLWPAITYLGSYLHKHDLSFEYTRLFHRDKAQLMVDLLNKQILTVAITTTVYVTPEPIIEIIDFVRETNPAIKIVVGGPYLSDKPKLLSKSDLQNLMLYLGADYYIFSSEGELTLKLLIEGLAVNSDLKNIPNLGFKVGDRYQVNEFKNEANSLEDNPINYTLFKKEDIGEFVTVRTAKSCPFSCAFCGFPERAGAYQYTSLECVEQELDKIRSIGGVSTITFVDDTFNVPKKRFKEILKMMVRKQYNFKWNSYLRSDHVDDEALVLMAASGCEGVFLGVESGSDKILSNMNKTSKVKDYQRVIERCRQLGIITYASLIIGFPGENGESVNDTFNFLETVKPDYFRAQVWYADPVTPIYRNGAKYGLFGEGFDWAHSTMNSQDAAQHVEELFVKVTGSMWLPQNGFEPWSLYYLQRKGFSLNQINEFLRCFNESIKSKLLSGVEMLTDDQFVKLTRSFNASC
ncbi:PhpK family radical SAM P-methyltransferase [Pseudomonas graminis]|uniref:PhpK family radical SAM P-methyltransferase n=1 Tax=Pseudomonas graminis TaxID=158627 RepID=UPI00234A7EAD|nr:PhpK family radical SAM P-methyltransferase [Pseudomonas graminis]MDC6379905.1 PhpK family radical SAM P-methyltransferase [Pseudomonas graminis]